VAGHFGSSRSFVSFFFLSLFISSLFSHLLVCLPAFESSAFFAALVVA
jgi:hypothetical protein